MISFDLLIIVAITVLFIVIGIYAWTGAGKEHDRVIRRQEDGL